MTNRLRDRPDDDRPGDDSSGQPAVAHRLSEMLVSLARDESRERISLADLLALMQGRAFGALLLVFAFPNILPTPPGTAGVLGLPLLFLATQMMLGQSPWLPRFIASRSLPRATIAAMIDKATPWLERAERLLRARMKPLASEPAQRVIGAVCLVIAIALVLPVPFGNMVPSIALCVIGLGILERDGLWIICGLLIGVAAVAYVGIMGYALVKSAIFVFLNAF